jgi:hypothetical protein
LCFNITAWGCIMDIEIKLKAFKISALHTGHFHGIRLLIKIQIFGNYALSSWKHISAAATDGSHLCNDLLFRWGTTGWNESDIHKYPDIAILKAFSLRNWEHQTKSQPESLDRGLNPFYPNIKTDVILSYMCSVWRIKGGTTKRGNLVGSLCHIQNKSQYTYLKSESNGNEWRAFNLHVRTTKGKVK